MPQPTITNTVRVYRLTRSGNSETYGDSPVITGLDVSVVPAGTDIIAVYGGGNTFALFEIFTHEKVTLRNGDKLVDGDVSWIVRGTPEVVENHLMTYVRVIGEQVAL